MIFNEFSDVDVRNIIGLDQIQRCFASPPIWKHPGFVVGGIDLSAAKKGGDECICVARMGNKFSEPYILPPCSSEMEVVGLLIRWLKNNKVRFLFVDSGNAGSWVVSRLNEILEDDKSIEIHGVGFGEAPVDPRSACKNRGTELWQNLANKLEMKEYIFEWSNEAKSKFIAQATSRALVPGSDGTHRLESKDKMRSRGLKSPDLVDAVVLACIEPVNENKSAFGNDLIDYSQFKKGDWNDSESTNRINFTSSGIKLGRG
jgi:hypothetical protein